MKAEKNEKKMESAGYRPRYYYAYDGATICLLMNPEGEVVARGISMCSHLDQFVKKTGRHKALGRAIQALEHREDMGEICWYNGGYRSSRQADTQTKVHQLSTMFGHFGTYRPATLTKLEESILNGKKKK